MRASRTVAIVALFVLSSGCRKSASRPDGVPSSAVLVKGAYIDCNVDAEAGRNHCTVYKQDSGEVLADGLFGVGYPQRPADKSELHYVSYQTFHFERFIVLANSHVLSLDRALERDPTNRLINEKLLALASSRHTPPAKCGTTDINEPNETTSNCAEEAFASRKPFYVRYAQTKGVSDFSYGLAGDGEGGVFEVVYDISGLLNLGVDKNSQVFDDNHIRVTTCMKPVALAKTERGTLACVQPVNAEESARVAQQKPINTTICAITGSPSEFNNQLVRIHGSVSGNFEYSELSADGCSDSIWFAYGNGEGPPGLMATISGGAQPGAEDSDGRRILPIPVSLVQDSNFNRFQKLMKAKVEADARSEKLHPGQYVFHRVTATFIGRIDAVSPDIHAFHLKKKPTDSPDYLGFGQMGLFDAQFVLQSVENDAVLGTEPPITRK